jgi:hypothetical protein
MIRRQIVVLRNYIPTGERILSLKVEAESDSAPIQWIERCLLVEVQYTVRFVENSIGYPLVGMKTAVIV